MPLGISKETVGMHFFYKEWEKWIHETHQKLKKRKDTNAKCTAYIEKEIQENFKSEGQHFNNAWVPISDFTKYKLRIKGSDNSKILQDRGNLKNQWKKFYTDEDAYIESGVNYGWKHHTGDPNNILHIDPRIHRNFKEAKDIPWPLPKRQILPYKHQVWPGIKKIYKMFLNKVLR